MAEEMSFGVEMEENDANADAQVIAGQRLYRPPVHVYDRIQAEAESNLRLGYAVGTYTDVNKINEILQYQFAFYDKVLNEKLPLIASLHLMEFILWQYDITARIEHLSKKDRLSPTEASAWRRVGPAARRSLKFLAEEVTRSERSERLPLPDHTVRHIRDIVWVCAEEVMMLSQLSDQTFFLYPKRTVLDVLPEGNPCFIRLTLRDFDDDLFRRVTSSRNNEGNYLPKPDFESDVGRHAGFVNAMFYKELRTTYEDMLRCLVSLIEEMPAESMCDVPVAEKEWVIKQTSHALSVSEQAAARILAGFTVTKREMDKEGRVLWKPNQEHRAFYRGFFELPHTAGPILMWSREMARECFVRLSTGLVYRHIAPEWASDGIKRAVTDLSCAHGRWFEEVTSQNLRDAGFAGVHSRRSIGVGTSRIVVPTNVGEVDYLGYSPNESLLVLAECKATCVGAEARFFRNELKEYVTGRKSYARRFRNKIDWVRDRWRSLCAALESEPDVQEFTHSVSPTTCAAIMITRRPTVVSEFIDDFPCVSLTELRMGQERLGRWPYDLAKKQL